mmetsp:Transcript_66044/g.193663  ORF Transcript_66044/g.193663 Transcript_66044/m.193663 type:complete len:278 (+) Transcript_66044:110-943(+)
MGLLGASRPSPPSPPREFFSASATLARSGACWSSWKETSRTAGQGTRRRLAGAGPVGDRLDRRERRFHSGVGAASPPPPPAPEYSAKTSGRDSSSWSRGSAPQQRVRAPPRRWQQYLCSCSRSRPCRPLPREAASALSTLRNAQPRQLSALRAMVSSTSMSPLSASPCRRSSEEASRTSNSSRDPGRSGSETRKASSQIGGGRWVPPLTRLSTQGVVAKGRMCDDSRRSACHGFLTPGVRNHGTSFSSRLYTAGWLAPRYALGCQSPVCGSTTCTLT